VRVWQARDDDDLADQHGFVMARGWTSPNAPAHRAAPGKTPTSRHGGSAGAARPEGVSSGVVVRYLRPPWRRARPTRDGRAGVLPVRDHRGEADALATP